MVIAKHNWLLPHDFSGLGQVLYCPDRCPGPKPTPNLTSEERDGRTANQAQGTDSYREGQGGAVRTAADS